MVGCVLSQLKPSELHILRFEKVPRCFLSQSSTNFHEILQAKFSRYVATTPKGRGP